MFSQPVSLHRTLKRGALSVGLPLLCILAFLIARQIQPHLDSLWQPSSLFQITTNSMAPALLGPRYPAQCQLCQQIWQIAAETYNESQPIECPACNSNQVEIERLMPGEIVRVTTNETSLAAPEVNRLDCIVFSELPQFAEVSQSHQVSPNRSWKLASDSWTCKRVWGLPGEEIVLRQGQLWINGNLYQKTLDQLQKVAVLVSDFPNDSTVYWQLRHSGKPIDLSRKSEKLTLEPGWELHWNYRSQYQLSDRPNQPHPVLDDYWENHSTPRSLLPVNDLLLTVEFQSMNSTLIGNGLPGRVQVECSYYGLSRFIECRFDNRSTIQTNSSESWAIAVNPQRLCIGGWDGRIWVQWDNQPSVLLAEENAVMATERESRDGNTESGFSKFSPTTTFTIRGLTGAVQINRLLVQRDLYLRYNDRDPRNGEPEPTILGSDCYYVIGDNLPISRDSRNGLGSVLRRQIIGTISENHSPQPTKP